MTKPNTPRGHKADLCYVLVLLLCACSGPGTGSPASGAVPPSGQSGQAGSYSDQSLSAEAAQRRAGVTVGEWVVLKTSGAPFVPLYSSRQPGSYRGLKDGTIAQIAAFERDRTWFKVRLRNGEVGWVQAANIAWELQVTQRRVQGRVLIQA